VITHYLKVFIALYVLVNPFEGLPIFLAHTDKLDRATRLAIGRTASWGVCFILLGAMAFGRALLAVFSISIGDFTAAGGIIIFLVALNMVLGPSAEAESSKAASSDELRGFGIVPLATPLLAGPGAISAVIVYAVKGPTGQGNSPLDYLILSAVIVAVAAATSLALRAGSSLKDFLGSTGIDVSTRLSGILVAAIAIGMLTQGLQEIFPVLAR